MSTEDFHWVMVSIDGDEEFRAFGGPRAACEEYAAEQRALHLGSQRRTARVVPDSV